MSKIYRIAPSILSADFARLGDEVKQRHRGRRRLDPFRRDGQPLRAQPDVRADDLLGLEAACRHARTGAPVPVDVHLMVQPVDALAQAFAQAGADYISFHPDASAHVHRSVQAIKAAGCKAGLVFNPAAPLDVLDWMIEDIDLILIMSVNPGFGGQGFIDSALRKIEQARAAHRRVRQGHPPRGRRRHQGRQHRPGRRGRGRHLRGRQRHLRQARLPGA